jgi:hypothetical protein
MGKWEYILSILVVDISDVIETGETEATRRRRQVGGMPFEGVEMFANFDLCRCNVHDDV